MTDKKVFSLDEQTTIEVHTLEKLAANTAVAKAVTSHHCTDGCQGAPPGGCMPGYQPQKTYETD